MLSTSVPFNTAQEPPRPSFVKYSQIDLVPSDANLRNDLDAPSSELKENVFLQRRFRIRAKLGDRAVKTTSFSVLQKLTKQLWSFRTAFGWVDIVATNR